MDRLLLVGLGNPGRKYRETRHNIGFNIVDALAGRHDIEIGKKKFKGEFAEETLFGKKIYFLKPQDFMNLSGPVVDAYMGYFKVGPEELLVVHDDIDLELGKMKLMSGAGHGGNNGVRSIFDWIYTQDFYRLRFGVGRPPEHMDPADYVLSKFSEDEMGVAEEMVERAVIVLDTYIKEGLAAARSKIK